MSKFPSFLAEKNYITTASTYKWIANYSAEGYVIHHCNVEMNVANGRLFPNYIVLYGLCPNQ